jgi:succinoglycan biosynthesis protein ExoM
MMNISICICTRKRQEGLKKLLHSFEQMLVPSDTNIRIIIVENDTENNSGRIVEEFSLKSKFKISYFQEPRRGIVFARNRSVKEAGDCDFCCFTDDDQTVSSGWLTELLRCQQEFDADGVAGPTMPSFTMKVPVYIENFHKPNTYPYGTIVDSAFTGNLLLRKKFLDLLDGPFNIRLNLSGGEDSFLTREIIRKAGIIRFNPDAVAYEIIPADRSTVAYVIKRKFRTSNTELLIKSMIDNKFSKIDAIPRLVMRFCNGLIIIIPYLLFGKTQKLKGLLKIINAAGGFSFIFGKQSLFYK